MYEIYIVFVLMTGLLLAVAGMGLFLLSATFRDRVLAGLSGSLRFCLRLGMQGGGTLSAWQGQLRAGSSRGWQQAWQGLLRNRWLVLALACVLMTPLLLVLMLNDRISAGQYDDRELEGNPLVAQLLHGEQLVPPPALPPEAFISRDVELIRPMLQSASRDWLMLDGDFRQRMLVVFRLMEEQHGYKMVLLEGYRSPDRQNLLAGMGTHVSNARAFQSYHQYGLAADCAFVRDGKLLISERDPWVMRGYQLYGVLAESLGLVWGGRWKMMDFGHIELRRSGVLGKPVPPIALIDQPAGLP